MTSQASTTVTGDTPHLPLVPPFTLRARLLTPLAAGGTRAEDDALVSVDEAGRIALVDTTPPPDTPAATGMGVVPHYDLRPALLMPGMIDAHAHLPQVPITGLDFDSPLMPWLRTYMVPSERPFNAELAHRLAPLIFRAFAGVGTTTVALNGAADADGTDEAFRAAESHGIRLVLGQCLMDRRRYEDDIPDNKVTSVRLRESADLCMRWHGRDGGRLRYAFTPRGGMNCSRQLLEESARLAKASGVHWQTHLSESPEEIDLVLSNFPEARDFLDVYERVGGSGPHVLFAHAVHLSDDEVARLAASGSRVVHCPSNIWGDGGLMPLSRYLRAGLPVGIGSDVGGSSSLSIFVALQLASITQRVLRLYGGEADPILRPLELIRLGTLEGARALGIEGQVGSIEAGKEADLIVIDTALTEPIPGASASTADELATRLILHSHPRMVQGAWVRGRRLPLPRET